MSDKPGKDDVHEQRHTNQTAEGVVKGRDAGASAQQPPRAVPAKPAPRENAKGDAEAPPKTPDTTNRPD